MIERLYDRLVRHGFRAVFSEELQLAKRMRSLSREVLAGIPRPVVISVDRAASEYWETDQQDAEERDFPCLADPWPPRVFFEYRAPGRIVTAHGSEVFDRAVLGSRFGVLLISRAVASSSAVVVLPRRLRQASLIEASVFSEFDPGDIACWGAIGWAADGEGAFVSLGPAGSPPHCGFRPPFDADLPATARDALAQNCFCFLRPVWRAIRGLSREPNAWGRNGGPRPQRSGEIR